MTFLIAGFGLVFLLVSSSLGYDTDLYTVTGAQVPPNVLIVLDNSSSMGTADQMPDYNPACADVPNCTILPPAYTPESYPANAVYKKSGNDWTLYVDHYNLIPCAAAQSALSIYGIYNGGADANCGGGNLFLQTGNYMNYLVLAQTSNQPRLGLAKGTIHSYVNSTQGINFGLMIFNGGTPGQGGNVAAPISSTKTNLFNALAGISTSNLVDWTPLAETLYEAMLYFKGAASYYNPPTQYTSPIQYWCQKNYVIIITDGFPTYDVVDDPTSPIRTVIGDYDGDGNDPGTYDTYGSHYLDDVAMYVHQNDLTTAFQGRQNLTVYTIGFNPSQLALDSTLLRSAASQGGGKFYYVHNSGEFKAALQSIIEAILESSVSYVAPTVPISQMERTTSVDRIYLGMFKPTEKSFWKGNIKKFGIATTANASKGVLIGDVIDVNGDLAIDPATNEICDVNQRSSYTATSYWSTTPDGSDVEEGGIGAKLMARDFSTNPRMIYTYNTSVGNTDLTHGSNRFNTTNITPAVLGYTGPTAADDASKLINFLYGYDAYDENGNLITAEKRSWVLGAIIHSRPLVVQYTSRTVIYIGANDGMLHAFDDTSGEELWAFIPPDLLPRLQNLTGNTIEFFVDGSPKVYEGPTQKILVCGERRGGNYYFALDITNPLQPLLLWQIHPGLANYSEMGQTWSTPLIGRIKYGTTSSWVDKWVVFIDGGYDTNQDSLPVPLNADDSKGYAVYVVDVVTGGLIWKYTKTNNALMKYSIPSDVARVDTDGDGRIDRLYVGDMGGQMWRVDLSLHETLSSPNNWTAKLIFKSNDPAPTSGDRRKIFYPPDVGLEVDSVGNYESIIFGTGDREHPSEYAVYNRLYTIKDRNPTTPLTEADLVDVTLDLLQTGTAEQKQTTNTALSNSSGWFIILSSNSGEKCLAPPLLFSKISYYTTFYPQIGAPSNPCFLGNGTATLYAVSYLTGNAAFNFDLTNDASGTTLGRSDRSIVVGSAIPSGAIIAVVGGSSTTGYIGIGGGIYKAPLKSSNVLVPINWKQQF